MLGLCGGGSVIWVQGPEAVDSSGGGGAGDAQHFERLHSGWGARRSKRGVAEPFNCIRVFTSDLILSSTSRALNPEP